MFWILLTKIKEKPLLGSVFHIVENIFQYSNTIFHVCNKCCPIYLFFFFCLKKKKENNFQSLLIWCLLLYLLSFYSHRRKCIILTNNSNNKCCGTLMSALGRNDLTQRCRRYQLVSGIDVFVYQCNRFNSPSPVLFPISRGGIEIELQPYFFATLFFSVVTFSEVRTLLKASQLKRDRMYVRSSCCV